MYISHISLFLHTHFLNQLVFPGVLFRFPNSNKKCLVVFVDLRGPLKTQDRSSPATFAPHCLWQVSHTSNITHTVMHNPLGIRQTLAQCTALDSDQIRLIRQ